MSAADVSTHQRARIHSAMIEIVAERGYDAVRVRDLVKLANVSSRTFYENFDSKEDCFLGTYEMVTRRAVRRFVVAQADEPEWRNRPALAFAALARELENGPAAARFILVEAYSAGPAALEAVRVAEREYEATLGQSFARMPGGIVVPPLVVEGILGGLAGVARTRVRAGREGELAGLGDELMRWALSYPGTPTNVLVGLDGQSLLEGAELERDASLPLGERGDLIASVIQLAVAIGYEKLTITRIRIAAKVSRKGFDANFEGVEDCFVAALELKADQVLARTAFAQAAGDTWPGSVYRGIAAVCEQLAADPFIAMACLANPFAEDSSGDRSQRRLVAMIAEQFGDLIPANLKPTILGSEASSGALWALLHRHLVRNWSEQRRIAATLAFMALAPMVGGPDAVAAIRGEQGPGVLSISE
jgi:AcrR family transcriptional regulator